MRPKLLDLFCGAGGCSMGYYRAGFDIVGVDIKPQPRYPFEFMQADAMNVLATGDLGPFDAIHASPPCQAFSPLRAVCKGKEFPDLISNTRELREGFPLLAFAQRARAREFDPNTFISGCP